MSTETDHIDPSSSTKPEFSRRGFVSLGAATALVAGNAAAAGAQSDGFGKPHPPIAPQLFDRLNAPSGDGKADYQPFVPLATQMTAQGFVTSDALAAHDWIRAQAADAPIGITGFCMGGSIVLQQIIDSKAYAAASMFYGDVRPGTKRDDPTTPATFDFTSRITTPLLGSFGARDTSIKPEDVTAMFARLTAPHSVKIYDEAGHAFFDDTRDSYVPSAAADAWARTLAWFRQYLR